MFFEHKYLTNPTVTHADRVVQAARELYTALSKKKQGMDKSTMEGLRELSKLYLKTAERSDAKEWAKEATQDPIVPHKPKVTFSDKVTVMPANPTPRRATREVANLDPTTIVGNNRSTARNTRAKFVVAAAALSAIVSNSQAAARQWEHRKDTPVAHKLELDRITAIDRYIGQTHSYRFLTATYLK